MNNPKVSIITMIYNNEQFVDTAVASILEQDYPHIEVIIRDDGSRSFHPERIRSLFDGAEDRLEGLIIEQSPSNMGTVNNFNSAIALATGEIIIPLSCDDSFLDSTTVSQIVDTFRRTGCLICSARRKSRQTGELAPDMATVDAFLAEPDRRFARLCYSNFISGATVYYSRQILEQLGCFDTRFRLLEDYPFLLQTVLAGIEIAFMEQPTIVYNEGGISQKQKKSKVHPLLQQDFKLVYEMVIFPNEQQLPKKMQRYLRYRYLRQYGSSGIFQKLWGSIRFADVAGMLLIWKLTGKTDRFGALME